MAAPAIPDGTGATPENKTVGGPVDSGGTARDSERRLRREVGPTAWAVLTDLCLDARSLDARSEDGDVMVVAASARRVAVNLGIGKDAAARALRRLIGAGVLRRRAQASDTAGRFAPCICELHLAHTLVWPRGPAHGDTAGHPGPQAPDTANNVTSVSRSSDTVARRGASRRRGPGLHRSLGDQLSLLDAAPDSCASSSSGGAS